MFTYGRGRGGVQRLAERDGRPRELPEGANAEPLAKAGLAL